MTEKTLKEDARPQSRIPRKPGLFRDFVGARTDDEFVEFFERFGPLGVERKFWRSEQKSLSDAVARWDKLMTLQRDARPALSPAFAVERKFRPAREALLMSVVQAINNHLASSVIFQVALNRPALVPVPLNLLGELWLQFAEVVSETNSERECRECLTWFIPKRSDAAFCSPACKTRWHRRQRVEGR